MKEVNETELVELMSSDKLILLDMYATWCGPCKMLMPRLDKLKEQYPNVDFVKMDVDQNMQFALGQSVRSVPTVMIFKGSNLVDRSAGANPDTYYKEKLDSLL